ncbi:leucine-rich repeat-containing protein 58-like [Bolinopsis microptera]|uniref:leucine-rich repeat-containing protein 58-like n=1 Tax=Bolinopsis microptera TaxID=2820187 RepID=UPI00307927A3
MFLCLEYLYLGGNRIVCLPEELGFLHASQRCIFTTTASHLRSLRTLTLHNNNLSSLPRGFLTLKHLESLTIRQNPLVQDFVRKLPVGPPSLQEVAGRVIKNNDIYYSSETLPQPLVDYLNSAKRCVNPQCDCVYFDTRVQDVEFVDFCGLYRVPLHHFICSAHPIVEQNNANHTPSDRMRRVLLG